MAFSAAVNIITITSNEPTQRHTKRIEIQQSQTYLFPKRSAKMIEGSEERKRQFAFELQNS